MQKSMRRIKSIPVSRRAALDIKKTFVIVRRAPQIFQPFPYCRAMAQPG